MGQKSATERLAEKQLEDRERNDRQREQYVRNEERRQEKLGEQTHDGSSYDWYLLKAVSVSLTAFLLSMNFIQSFSSCFRFQNNLYQL